MKAIIVYYSLEGNTEYVVKQLQKEMDVDVCQLKPLKAYPTGKISKFWVGGSSVVFGKKPELEPYVFDEKNYDTVIIATPIWAGSYVPPIKTFLSKQKLKDKKLGLVACSGSGNAEKCFNRLKIELPGCQVKAELSLANPAINKKEEDAEKIRGFVKQMQAE